MENREQMLQMVQKLREAASAIEQKVQNSIEQERIENFIWHEFNWKLVMEGTEAFPFDIYGIPVSDEAKTIFPLPNNLCKSASGRLESTKQLSWVTLKEFLASFPEIKKGLDWSEVKTILEEQIQNKQERLKQLEELFQTNE